MGCVAGCWNHYTNMAEALTDAEELNRVAVIMVISVLSVLGCGILYCLFIFPLGDFCFFWYRFFRVAPGATGAGAMDPSGGLFTAENLNLLQRVVQAAPVSVPSRPGGFSYFRGSRSAQKGASLVESGKPLPQTVSTVAGSSAPFPSIGVCAVPGAPFSGFGGHAGYVAVSVPPRSVNTV